MKVRRKKKKKKAHSCLLNIIRTSGLCLITDLLSSFSLYGETLLLRSALLTAHTNPFYLRKTGEKQTKKGRTQNGGKETARTKNEAWEWDANSFGMS